MNRWFFFCSRYDNVICCALLIPMALFLAACRGEESPDTLAESPGDAAPSEADFATSESAASPSPLANQAISAQHSVAELPYLQYDAPANPNGSFEESRLTGGIPGWEIESASGLRWRQSGGAALDGNYAMLLEGPATASEDTDTTTRLLSEPLAAQPGDLVQFSAWIITDTPADAVPMIYVEAETPGGWERLTPYPHRNEAPAGQWLPLSKTVVVPGEVAQVRMVAEADAATVARGNRWFVDAFHSKVVSFRDYVAQHREQPRLEDILLYGMDTLRQSPLGSYGSETVHTPNMDLVAHEGITFRHVIANSPWTRPSFASIFTSLYPSQHTAELHNSILPDSVTTLAELLQANGYFTVAFVKTPFDGFIGPGAGCAQGFDAYFYTPGEESLISDGFDDFLVHNADALAALEGGGIFIFRHYWDFHDTYINHYPEMIHNDGLLGDAVLDSHTLWSKLYPMQESVVDDRDVDYAVAVYEAQAKYVDDIVGRTFQRLKHVGLFENLNIVIASDHGESFNEKEGVWYHGNPYITSTEVPLILRFPGRIAPGQFDNNILASNLDIMPTLLALADIPIPEDLEGRNLLDMAAIPGDRICVSEDRKMGSITLRDTRYKLVAIPASLPSVTHEDPYEYWLSLQPGTIREHMEIAALEFNRDWILDMPESPTRYELYDLENDPFQHHDIAESHPEVFNRLIFALLQHCLRTGIVDYAGIVESGNFDIDDAALTALEAFAASLDPATAHTPGTVDLTPETLEQLQAQGYL